MESLETAQLMTIGRFARLTGLTVKALRHYDELGLLRPAAVDPETGYRLYGAEQVGGRRRSAHLGVSSFPSTTSCAARGRRPRRSGVSSSTTSGARRSARPS